MRFARSRVGAAISKSTYAEARSCAASQSPAFEFPIHAADNAIARLLSNIRSFTTGSSASGPLLPLCSVVEPSVTALRPKRSGGGADRHLDRGGATEHRLMLPRSSARHRCCATAHTSHR